MLDKHSYCVKCHSSKTIVGQTAVVMKNGATALKGKCPSCEAVTYKIVNKDALKAEEAVKPAKQAKSAHPSKASNHSKLEKHVGLALATFALGLAIGAAIAMYI